MIVIPDGMIAGVLSVRPHLSIPHYKCERDSLDAHRSWQSEYSFLSLLRS